MLFNSFHFLVFFPIVTAGYFLLSARFRWMWLLAASCYFYMVFRPIYILILLFTILVDYFSALQIDRSTGRRRKQYLLASIFANVGVLAFFKYYNFLNGNLLAASHWFHVSYDIPFLNIILPIGLSFHTFQSLSYTIEVYRGKYPVERHFGIFALYVMFYPQLVAGPIERPQDVLPQLHKYHPFDYLRVTSGLKLMLWGMLKKVVIADRLAPFVNQVYDHPTQYQGISYILATFFFAFQIYCDFSGYSDIALGSAEVMGIELMQNFRRPYFSSSVSEFWRRWHISLSSWFRDYVYIPLGGNRTGPIRRYANLMITFLLSGLWHGANWTYVIWGGLNGVYLSIEQLAGRISWNPLASRSGAVRVVRVGLTFTVICIAWIFFRARNFHDAWYILSHLSQGLSSLPGNLHDRAFQRSYILMLQDKTEFILAWIALAMLLAVESVQEISSLRQRIALQPRWLRWSLYYAAGAVVLFFGAFNTTQQFIYFQF